MQRSDTHVLFFVSWLESGGSCVHWVASCQRAVASVLRNCTSSDLLPVLQELLEVRYESDRLSSCCHYLPY